MSAAKRPPPPQEAPWAAWKSTEADTEATSLRLSVQIVKSLVNILPGGALHAGKTSYADMLHFGFWIGVDSSDKKPKINIGGPSWYLKFTGTGWDISLYAGLEDGGHVGMAYRETDDTDQWLLEGVDAANVPFFSVVTGLTVEDTDIVIGYAERDAKITLLGQDIVVDVACIPGLSLAIDASTVTYTATTATDWDSNTDPGDVDNALDQLAERVDDIEALTLGVHAHTDAASGGVLSAYLQTAVGITATLTDALGNLWLFANGQLTSVISINDLFGQWPVGTWPTGYET